MTEALKALFARMRGRAKAGAYLCTIPPNLGYDHDELAFDSYAFEQDLAAIEAEIHKLLAERAKP